jgi:hypothetical protein
MKKNTLLYLDSNLVEKAKAANLNISQFVEKKLKEELRADLPKTPLVYLQRVITDTIQKETSFYGEAYQYPFQIESLKLENIGLFKSIELHFKKDAINLIYGVGASGKSTIVRSILLGFGNRHKYFPKTDNGAITLKLFPDQTSLIIKATDQVLDGFSDDYKCFIGDGILQVAPRDMATAVLQELNKFKIQSIITTSMPVDPSDLPESTNVICLDDPASL